MPNSAHVAIDGGPVIRVASSGRLQEGTPTLISLRPEQVWSVQAPGLVNSIPVTVLDTVYHGDHLSVRMAGDGIELIARVERKTATWTVGTAGSRNFRARSMHIDRSIASRLKALGLVLPLVAFLALLLRLAAMTMMVAAVSDGTVRGVLPETAAALSNWDGASPPGPELGAALVTGSARHRRRRWHSVMRSGGSTARYPASASLLSRTANAVRDAPEGEVPDLAGIDERWADPKYWLAMKRAMPPLYGPLPACSGRSGARREREHCGSRNDYVRKPSDHAAHVLHCRAW